MNFILKKPWEESKVNLWETITGRILAIFNCYNCFDQDLGKTVYETNKFNYWDEIYLFDNVANKVHRIGKDKKVLNEWKEKIKQEGLANGNKYKLKYNKVLYIQLEDGTICEYYIKLSQTHKVSKDGSVVKYDLSSPLEGWLESFLSLAKEQYPFHNVELELKNYFLNPFYVVYPVFKSTGITALEDINIVQDLFNRINALTLAKAQSMDIEQQEGNETIQEAEVIEEATVIEKKDDDLPF